MMRAMKKYLCLFVLLMVVGCRHHYQYPPILQEADSLCVAQPDSAISLLKSISTEMLQAPEYVQKRYHLLTIKANDKAYITHTSDSLILSLVDYYEHGGDKDFLGEAYYYAGSTYRDLGDAPRALEYFQKALDAMPGDENLKVKSKVYAQMGDLLSYQDLTGEALLKYKQSYYYEKTRNDTAGMVYSLRDIGYTYRRLDNIDSAFYYYKKAESISSSFGDIALSNLITSQIAALYSEIGMYDSAKYYLQPSLEHLSRTNFSSIYSIASNLYYRIGQYDSVHYYDSELLKYGNQQAKLYAYYKQARIASLENKYEDAISLMTDFFLLNDSIQKTVDAETLSRMNALYNYQLRERENAKLQIQRQQYYILFLGASLVVIILLVSGSYVVRWYLQRQRKYREALTRILTEVYRKTDAYIEEKKLEIEEVERLLGDLSFDDELERKHQERRMESLRLEMERSQAELELQHRREIEIMNSDVQNLLSAQAVLGNMLKKEDWTTIEQTINTIYPEFIEKLRDMNGMTDIKEQVCLLTKLHQRNTDIATFVGRTPSAITRLKTRFMQDLGISDPNLTFDEFIRSL